MLQNLTASTTEIGGDRKPLDLIAAPEGYAIWRERAIDHLAKGRKDIQQLLRWAEGRTDEVDTKALEAQCQVLKVSDGSDYISYVFHGALKHIMSDSLLDRARNAGTHGIELWRALHAEWRAVHRVCYLPKHSGCRVRPIAPQCHNYRWHFLSG